MKVFKEIIICAVLLGTFYACASTNDETKSSVSNNMMSVGKEDGTLEKIDKDDSKLSKTKKAKISIEGEEEEITVNLYESKADFPMPFYVYVPAKFKASEAEMSGNKMVVFTSGPAMFKILTLPTKTSEDDAKGIAKDLVREKGNMRRNETEEEKIYYLADEDKEVYTTEVRETNGKQFIIITEMPVEYVDGFFPRAEMISENIVWK